MAKRWQYSSKNGDDIILVDYTDEKWEEFVLDVTRAQAEFSSQEEQEKPERSEEPPRNTKYICNTCGAEASLKQGTSKKGNFYKIMKCSKNEEHDQFMR